MIFTKADREILKRLDPDSHVRRQEFLSLVSYRDKKYAELSEKMDGILRKLLLLVDVYSTACDLQNDTHTILNRLAVKGKENGLKKRVLKRKSGR